MRTPPRRRLLTIGHSYVVAGNRRLADEMARQSGGRWEVTAAAPQRLRSELRAISLEPISKEASAVRPLPVVFSAIPQLRCYRRLRALLREPWDLVHLWEEPYVVAGAQVAAFASAETRIVPATFQNIAKRYPPPFAWFERAVLRRSVGWIAFGQSIFEAQRDKPAYAARPSRIISPGVDLDRFRPDPEARRTVRQRLGWDESVPVVGFVGRFVPEKGLTTLRRALEQTRGPWRVLFVGAGPLAREVAAFAAEHPDRARVLSNVAHDQVPAHLNAMDLLCAPSETTQRWREQFGRMLIEAMACGVPVAASASGEIPHVVADAGILLPERSPERWAEAIDRLLADPRERADLAARGIERANERFALPIVAAAHLRFFEELL